MSETNFKNELNIIMLIATNNGYPKKTIEKLFTNNFKDSSTGSTYTTLQPLPPLTNGDPYCSWGNLHTR